jgi:hypothetical protein
LSGPGLVGIVTRLWAGRSGVWVPGEARDFSFFKEPRLTLGTNKHPTEPKLGALEANHPPPFSVEVKNDWRCASAPPVCIRGMYMNAFLKVNVFARTVVSLCK